jgi:hypothetical protein
MRQHQLFQQDFGAPPPPPPGVAAPPPPPTGSGSQGGSASTNAIIALIAGIASFVFCPFILGIVAWIMGKGEVSKIDRGESSEAGRGMAKIGMWLGIINVILSIIFALIYALIIVIALVSGSR